MKGVKKLPDINQEWQNIMNSVNNCGPQLSFLPAFL